MKARKTQLNLLAEMVRTDFKLRYQGSWFGYVWSLLKPLLLFLILYMVFTRVFRLGDEVENYSVYLLFGIVLWTYFTEATTRGLTIIVERGDLIRKIALPRYLLVVSVNISALINLVINLGLVLVFAVVLGVDFRPEALLTPIPIGALLVFTLSCSFLLSALYVKARDMTHLWEVALQGAFYATPILYPMSLVPEAFQSIVFLNPLAQIIQDARWLLVTDTSGTVWSTSPVTFIGTLSVFIVIGVLGIYFFKKYQATFAEDV